MDRQLRPGDALQTETELATQFGVNRSTVREGIRHLEQTGLVERRGKKLIVTRPSSGQVGDQVSRALVVHDVTFQELWEVKLALEPLAASLAAKNADPEMLQRLEESFNRCRDAYEAGRHMARLVSDFHALIAEASGNSALVMAREPMGQLFYTAYVALADRTFVRKGDTSEYGDYAWESGDHLLKAHQIILDAIRAGDGEKAAEWMHKHVVGFRAGYVRVGLSVDDPVPYVR